MNVQLLYTVVNMMSNAFVCVCVCVCVCVQKSGDTDHVIRQESKSKSKSKQIFKLFKQIRSLQNLREGDL